MRLKFERGMTPEDIGRVFAAFIRANDLVIGAVNIYVQTYDEAMQPSSGHVGEYIAFMPSEEAKRRYTEDVATIRRSRMRVV